MFEHHRKSPWFAEKYDPALEFENLRKRVRKEGWKGRLNNFLHDIETGKFDPDLHEPEAEPSSPIKENGESAPERNIVGEDATKSVANHDDDMQFNAEPDEDGGDLNGKMSGDSKRIRSDEYSVPTEGNQVMIRTIPPDIGRVKLEEVRSASYFSSHVSESHFVLLQGLFQNAWVNLHRPG